MGKTKIEKPRADRMPNAFFVATMRTTDGRSNEVESENQQWVAARTEFHTAFTALDDAYQRSLASMATLDIAGKDDERDVWGQVLEQVAKQWARMPDDTMALHGRRVLQVFRDIDFRTTEALVAENAKIQNMEQRFAEDTLAADLAAMGLTELNTRLKQLSAEIQSLINQRSEEQSTIVVGELKQAREALDAHYRAFITYINAVQEIQPEEQISQAAQFYNQDIKKIEEQIAQSRRKKKGEDVEPEDDSQDGDSDVTPVKPE